MSEPSSAAVVGPPPMPKVIGEYPIESVIGGGGQGSVYRVRDPNIPGKYWALKLYADEWSFKQEKSALIALENLHQSSIPRLANAFTWNGHYALVITYFPGQTLKQVRQEWRWVSRTLHTLSQLLQRIHGAGYLYLDLKPDNVIFGQDGQLYLVDYSLVQAKQTARSNGLGTRGFAPPEQMSRAAPLTCAADAYALGALGYYLLTGAPPNPHAPPQLPSIPPSLEALLQDLIHSDAVRRADLARMLHFSVDVGEHEMCRCLNCRLEMRLSSHTCVKCGTRVQHAPIPAPDFGRQPRVLPQSIIEAPLGNTNRVLGELSQPSRRHDMRLRDLRLQAEAIAQVKGFDELQAPTRLRHLITFYPHQRDTARRALRDMRGNAILADEVGLGKTIEAGLITKELVLRTLVKRVLILTPTHLVDQWAAEMNEKFGLNFLTYASPADWGQPYLVASIHAFARNSNQIRLSRLQHPYDLVIVDEMHNLLRKNGRPRSAYDFLTQFPRTYMLLLSATPIRRHLHELFYLVNLIQPGSFQSEADFLSRYTRWGKRINAAELRAELQRVMIRHSRRSLPAEDLPPQRDVRAHEIIPSLAEQSLLEEVENSLHYGRVRITTQSLSFAYSSPASQAQLLGKQLDKMSCMKLEEAVSILSSINAQAIIFTREVVTGRYLEQELTRRGFHVIFFRPGLSRRQKAEQFYKFKRDPKGVLVATDVAAEGRNLQFARHLINFDIPWNPLKLEQRIGRIDRLGQKQQPIVYNLYYPRTFEGEVYRLFDRGLRMFELIIGELASVLDELEEFNNQTLDEVVTYTWARHAQDPVALNLAMHTLAAKLQQARKDFDQEKDLSQSIDEDLF